MKFVGWVGFAHYYFMRRSGDEVRMVYRISSSKHFHMRGSATGPFQMLGCEKYALALFVGFHLGMVIPRTWWLIGKVRCWGYIVWFDVDNETIDWLQDNVIITTGNRKYFFVLKPCCQLTHKVANDLLTRLSPIQGLDLTYLHLFGCKAELFGAKNQFWVDQMTWLKALSR